MKHFTLLFVAIFVLGCGKRKKDGKTSSVKFEVGIVSDCQYCDCPTKWGRYFKKSPQRLKDAVDKLNTYDLAFTIHLGDFIDQGFLNFDTLNPIWKQLKSTSYHVLGNHDFSVADSLKNQVPNKLQLEKRYYSFQQNNWKFIVLDGNDLSFYGSTDSLKIKQADALFSAKKKALKPYAQEYNGGLSKEQLQWVEQELMAATQNKQQVGFFCHFPVLPIDKHNLWNTEEFLALIQKYPVVKVYMAGHNHAGSYSKAAGVHYITFKGMVDTPDSSSFSVAQFTKDSIFIKGFGREKDKKLKIRK